MMDFIILICSLIVLTISATIFEVDNGNRKALIGIVLSCIVVAGSIVYKVCGA